MRIAIATLAVLIGAISGANAQDYPNRPTRLILGNAAGGPTDLAARMFADKMRGVLGHPWVVENRVGAGTMVATGAVAQAQPDGYTLLYGTASIVNGPSLIKGWNIDGVKDLTPVSLLVRGRSLVAVNPAGSYKTLDEFVAFIKANPGKLNYANISASEGLYFAMIKNTGLQFETIRYNGAAPSQAAVLAGQADFYSIPVGNSAKALSESGKIRLLAVMGAERSPLMPNIPSFAESSRPEIRELAKFPGFGQYWFTLMGPAGLPRPIVTTLHQSAVKVSADPEYVKRMPDLGLEIVASTPEQFTSSIIAERTAISGEAKKQGLQPE